MRRLALAVLAAAAALAGCASGPDMTYRPAPQILPQNIRKLGIRPIKNETSQFGLEDKLFLRLQDEFLRDGRYAVVPEPYADGVVQVIIKRYILQVSQYDATLAPTLYRLQIFVDLQFIDRTKNQILWQEPNIQEVQTYAPPTLPGGMTEEQAREALWDTLSRDVAKRTLEGFGSVTGSSYHRVETPPPPPPGQDGNVPGLPTQAGTTAPGQPKTAPQAPGPDATQAPAPAPTPAPESAPPVVPPPAPVPDSNPAPAPAQP